MSEIKPQNPEHGISLELLQEFNEAVGELLPDSTLRPTASGSMFTLQQYLHPYLDATIELGRVVKDGEDIETSLFIMYPEEDDSYPQTEGFSNYMPTMGSRGVYNYQPKMPTTPEPTMEELGISDRSKYLVMMAAAHGKMRRLYGDSLTSNHIRSYIELLQVIARTPELKLSEPGIDG